MYVRTSFGLIVADDHPHRPDPDRPDPVDVQPRRDLLGELLADGHRDSDPPTAPR